MESRSEKIARLNDEFRKSIRQGGHVYLTPGIQALPPKGKLRSNYILPMCTNFWSLVTKRNDDKQLPSRVLV